MTEKKPRLVDITPEFANLFEVMKILRISYPTYKKMLAAGTFPRSVRFRPGGKPKWKRTDLAEYIKNL